MERFEETLHEKHVIVLGGSSGIGLETARLARAQGAKLVLVARDERKLEMASRTLGGSARTAVFDVANEGAVRTFFEQSGRIDHVLLAAGGPFYAPLAQMNFSGARCYLDNRIWSALYVTRYSVPHMVPAGSLIFFSGTQVRRLALGLSVLSIVVHAIETLTENLALPTTCAMCTTFRHRDSDYLLMKSATRPGVRKWRHETCLNFACQGSD